MANDGRKSLMITVDAHSHIMTLSQTFGVSQPDLVDALLKNVDKARLQSALTEIAASRANAAEEAKKKKALLERALNNMSAADLEKLLNSAT